MYRGEYVFLGVLRKSFPAARLALFTALWSGFNPLWAAPHATAQHLTYWDLTRAERAVIDTFLRPENPLFFTVTTPANLAAGYYRDWSDKLTPDSYNRIAEVRPDLSLLVERGRQQRITFLEEQFRSFENYNERYGWDYPFGDRLVGLYSKLLAKQNKEKIPPDYLIRDTAEAKTRRLYQKELGEAFSKEAALREELGLPRLAIGELPKERWPKHILQRFHKEMEILREANRVIEPDIHLNAKHFKQWTQQVRLMASRQREKIMRPAGNVWEFRSDLSHLTKPFGESALKEVSQIQIILDATKNNLQSERRLLKSLTGIAPALNQKKENIKREVLGLPSGYGGTETKVVSPHLNFLLDLSWAPIAEKPDNVWSSRAEKSRNFYRPRISYQLDPKAYLRDKAYTFLGSVIGAAIGIAGIAAVLGGITLGLKGLSAAADKLGVSPPHAFLSDRYEPSLRTLPMLSRNWNPQTGKSQTISGALKGQHGTLFLGTPVNGVLPEMLYFPVKEDLEEKLTLETRTPIGDPDFYLSGQMPLQTEKGEFVMLPYVPGYFPVVEQVFQGPYHDRTITPASEYQVVTTPKGMSFLQFKNPDNFPRLWPSEYQYRVMYYKETRPPSPPPLPKLNTGELARQTSLLEDGEFPFLAKEVKRLEEQSKKESVTLKDLAEVIRNHSLYSHHPGIRHEDPENPVRGYGEFRNEEKHFCPDCDVASFIVKDLTDSGEPKPHEIEVRGGVVRLGGSSVYDLTEMHARLMTWQHGYPDPIILDPTPSQIDPRNLSDVREDREEFRESLGAKEAAERHQKLLLEQWRQPADHRFRFRGEVRLQEDYSGRGPDPEPAPLTKPESLQLAKRQEREQFKQKLLSDVSRVISEQEKSQTDFKAARIQLIKLRDSLTQYLKDLPGDPIPERGYPHQTILKLTQQVLNVADRKPGAEKALAETAAFYGGLNHLQNALQKQVSQFRQNASRTRQVQLAKALDGGLLERVWAIAQYLGQKQWEPPQLVPPSLVRKNCYEVLRGLTPSASE